MQHHLSSRKALAVIVSVLLMLPMTAGMAQAQPSGGLSTIPITGTFTDALGGVGNFAGTFDLQRFAVQNGEIVAVGTLTGSLTDSAGTGLGSVVRTVQFILDSTATQASCDILHLELGPLDLDLLGLVVHLNRIVLDIDAQRGPGNLLGNLLCAIANLLNGGGALSAIVDLLNQILQAL